ncbi:MAG TPA: adenylosuccinate synthetase [Sedimentisphaerales bacterium]|nr:adenylosuccinate synthetase [Sedimentisphaerales bacterium]
MPCTIVVGGQYGSEGKGKVVSLYSSSLDNPWVVRCGGPNSGHTTSINGEEVILRQVPAGASNPEAMLLLAAGCVIDEDVLLQEVHMLKLDRDRIIVDPRAVLVEDIDRKSELEASKQIGSTGSGTGAALIRRMTRQHNIRLVKDSASLQKHVRVESVAPLLHSCLDNGSHVVIEGTQGFGLSLLHGPYYPYLTARDTTASGFAMEVGLSPRQVDSIIMVIRTFPIRVGGNSGPIAEEISWDDIKEISGAPEVFPEYTSVTKRLRRVAHFDIEAVKMACKYNRPTSLAIMGIDRLDFRNYCIKEISDLTEEAKRFICNIKLETGIPVELVGTGFDTKEAIFAQISERILHG